MSGLLLRQDIWVLEEDGPWDPVTTAYALAVRVMKARDPSDPTSWAYQAAVHDVEDPATADRFRGQCQHNTWFFLPWHRLYLMHFEALVRAALHERPEVHVDDTWALPYWNYSAGTPRDSLPPAFREQHMPDGTDNPLYVPQRNSWINDGDPLPVGALSTQDSMAELVFSEPVVPNMPSGFGGSRTSHHHISGDGVPGELELTPHGAVHSEVGGHMAGFATAPLDPVFWLHHCNIDRLWAVWRLQQDRLDPAESRWLIGTRFDFHDATSQVVTSVPADVVRTEDLGYTYAELEVPPDPFRRRRSVAARARRRSTDTPQLVGASEQPVDLRGASAGTSFALERPPDVDERRRRRDDPDGPPVRVYLNIDGVEGEQNPSGAYGVYLNALDDDAARSDYHVGNVSFFGIEAASDVRRDHAGGHGLHFAFDVSDVVDALEAEGRWDPANIAVSFVPLRQSAPGPGAVREPPEVSVRIGRVSLFFQ